MAIDIVDLASYKMVIFHCYVGLPEGNNPTILPYLCCFVSSHVHAASVGESVMPILPKPALRFSFPKRRQATMVLRYNL